MEFRANSFQMLDYSTLEPVYTADNINSLVTTDVDTYSLSQEVPTFNHEAYFKAELIDMSPLLTYATDLSDKPLYIECNVPIMVQARWHKKPRINKKWLKRYGMKKDTVLVRYNVESVYPSTHYDPLGITEHVEYGMTFGSREYKFRPDQLRRNLKLEV
jgi:hypothetical protein